MTRRLRRLAPGEELKHANKRIIPYWYFYEMQEIVAREKDEVEEEKTSTAKVYQYRREA